MPDDKKRGKNEEALGAAHLLGGARALDGAVEAGIGTNRIRTAHGEAHTIAGTPIGPHANDRGDGQQVDYIVLSPEERAKGFKRPLRREYIHLECGTKTSMGLALCETYAREPSFYGATFCAGCRGHFPVGEQGEFVWIEADGSRGPKVGT